MFEWCSENIQGIIFIKIHSDYLKQHVKEHQLDARYVKDSVKSSRIHHSFIPRKSEFEMWIIFAYLTHSSKVPLSTANTKNVSDFNPVRYVPCIYAFIYLLPEISQISVEFDEMYAKIIKTKGEASCGPKAWWIPFFNCLGLTRSLNVQGQHAWTYIISEEEFEKFSSKMKWLKIYCFVFILFLLVILVHRVYLSFKVMSNGEGLNLYHLILF